MTTQSLRSDEGVLPALVVMFAGVSAALHVAKVFPALPVIRDFFGMTLVQSGFLLSIVQMAGMTLGLAVGLLADGLGLKRCMFIGLLTLFGAGALGGWAQTATELIALRVIEGAGFLLVCTPAPALIRQLVAPASLGRVLGIWSTYMPLATTLILLVGPALIALAGWQSVWWLLSALTLVMALLLWYLVPQRDLPLGAGGNAASRAGWAYRLRQTLTARGPWLVALAFATYASQWVSVIGFLPSIYRQAGYSGGSTAVLTALAAAVNIVGNVASGRLLARGIAPQNLMYTGFVVMGVMSLIAFAPVSAMGLSPDLPAAETQAVAVVRYLAILAFSLVGGMIPGTLFSMAVLLAPARDAVSTTVGWMQQWSAIGQFSGPPLVALVASIAGGWHWTWLVTGICSFLGLGLAWQIGQQATRLQYAQNT